MDIKNIITSAIIMLVLDGVYLTSISSSFKGMIRNIQGSDMTFRLVPVIICYIALVGGLNYFILDSGKSKEDMIRDAIILGLVICIVYETTNYALIDKWELKVALIDSIWGGALFGLTTFITLTVKTLL
jgi:uncharacterized membrane protein